MGVCHYILSNSQFNLPSFHSVTILDKFCNKCIIIIIMIIIIIIIIIITIIIINGFNCRVH